MHQLLILTPILRPGYDKNKNIAYDFCAAWRDYAVCPLQVMSAGTAQAMNSSSQWRNGEGTASREC